jgi:hypothetical protein
MEVKKGKPTEGMNGDIVFILTPNTIVLDRHKA